MWLYIVQGIGYGFAAAVQPGPFQTYLISQTLTKGWRRTLPASPRPIDQRRSDHCPLSAGAQSGPGLAAAVSVSSPGDYLFYISRIAPINPGKTLIRICPLPETGTQQSVLKAALINMLNPNPYIFWSLVTGPILLAGWRETPVHGLGFLLGFYLTMILGFCVIIIVFGSARQLGPKVNRALLGVSAIALVCFGLFQLWKGMIG